MKSTDIISEIRGGAMNDLNELTGFLEVRHVVKFSRAWDSGLRQGDIVLSFGPYVKENFTGLRALAEFIAHNCEQPIYCIIGRRFTGRLNKNGGEIMRVKTHMTITPKAWEHGTVLGAVINTYPPPQMVHAYHR